jgi:fructokinase
MKPDMFILSRFGADDYNSIVKFIYNHAKQNPDGFTVSIVLEANEIALYKTIKGKVAAYLATQNSFGNSGLRTCLTHALKNSLTIGGWLDEEDNQFYFDSVKIFETVEAAIVFGKEQEQIAIFDLDELNEIRL